MALYVNSGAVRKGIVQSSNPILNMLLNSVNQSMGMWH